MVMVEINNNTWYEDKKFLSNLNIYLDAMKDDDDLLLVFCGPEGAGKSKRLRQVGAYCANYLGTTFSFDNIKFDIKEYMDFSIDSPQYTVCVLDEARNQLNRKNSMTKVVKRFTSYLSECRKKRQVHIIALPAYHDLDRYVVLWRMKFMVLLHKWFEPDETRESGYKLGRGRYTMFINGPKIQQKYEYPYQYPAQWEVRAEFKNVEVLTPEDLKLYDDKKDDNIEKRYHSRYEEIELGKNETKWKARWYGVVDTMLNARGVSQGELADASKMEMKTFYSTLQQMPKNQN